MSEYQTIEFSVSRAGIALVILNRPDKHNAFDEQVIAELTDVFENLRTEDNVRMVILRGTGKSFSAGADLDWMKRAATFTQHENEEDSFALAEMLRRLYELPQLTVAAVNGAAMGGGAGLVAACDIGVAMNDAKFRFSEVRLGLIAATISPFVIQAIGPKWARALFTTAETFDATYAERMGLIQYTVETETEMEDTLEYLGSLAFGAAPGAVHASKELVQSVAGRPITSDLSHHTAKQIAAARVSDEGKEGVAAFLEKRKPNWAE